MVTLPTNASPRPARPEAGHSKLPLVYSCSGCSNVAQLANTLAVRLDREQLAEMSCIAGVGGDVRALVRTARSRRPIIVLDGCPLHCARHCLDRAGVSATFHIDLSKEGFRKRFHRDATPEAVQHAWENIVLPALERLDEQAATATDNPIQPVEAIESTPTIQAAPAVHSLSGRIRRNQNHPSHREIYPGRKWRRDPENGDEE